MAREEEEADEMPEAVSFLSSALERMTKANYTKTPTFKISAFEGVSRPTISIQNYTRRIFKYANCSTSCFVVAYIYLHRFSHPITSFSVHRLLITALMLAAKFMDDLYYNNAYYAKVGGISTREINLLELDFLFGLKFQLNVTPKTFHTYCSYLQREMLLIHSPINKPINLHQYCYNNEDDSTKS